MLCYKNFKYAVFAVCFISHAAYARTTGNYFLPLKDLAQPGHLKQIRSVACDGKHFSFNATQGDTPSLFLCSLSGEILDTVEFPRKTFLQSLDFFSSRVAVSDFASKKVFVYSVKESKLSLDFSLQFDSYPNLVRLNSTHLFVKNTVDEIPALILVDLAKGEISHTIFLEEDCFFFAANDTYLYLATQDPFIFKVINYTNAEIIREFELNQILLGKQTNLSGEITSLCCNQETVYIGVKDGPLYEFIKAFNGAVAFDKNGNYLFYQYQGSHTKDPVISCDDTFFYSAGNYDYRDLVTINTRGAEEWDIFQAFHFLSDQDVIITGDGTGQYVYVADGGFRRMLVYSRTDHIGIEPESVTVGVGGGIYFSPYGVDTNGERLLIKGFTEYSVVEQSSDGVGVIESIWENVRGIFTASSPGTFRIEASYGNLNWKATSLICTVVERIDSDGDGYSDENEKIMGTNPDSAVSVPSENGEVFFDQSVYYGEINTAVITVKDVGLNHDPSIQETCQVQITSSSDPIGFSLTLGEWGSDSGLFVSNITRIYKGEKQKGENIRFTTHDIDQTPYIKVADGEWITATYSDVVGKNGEVNTSRTTHAPWFEKEFTTVPAGGFLPAFLFILIPFIFKRFEL